MNDDPTYEELCAASPELESAGEDLVKQVWATTPNSKCFGMTPVEAYQLCAEVFNRMQAKKKEKPTGRKAAIEHTKRKNANE